MLDQFYWAERMYWLGVAPEPLGREHLVPDKDEDFYIKEAANMFVRALDCSQSSEVKSRALQISNKLSNELHGLRQTNPGDSNFGPSTLLSVNWVKKDYLESLHNNSPME
ncbi:hypothetical protein RND71_000509 [Anisodus tanguticus]|uniref:Uncharacterized protein n=1 Tax=Anisodus tanguticus TaxID=243964 RepID=A0AAE1T0M0_9SOLA|nr:hypothetical protein RND71_000509 [Anisodus tanguticus]